MALGGSAHLEEPSARCNPSPYMGSLSNVPPGPLLEPFGPQLPTIQPAPPNKGAPTLPPAPSTGPKYVILQKPQAHANPRASSASSAADTSSDLTSSSSRDAAPAAAAQTRAGETTPQKQARNNRRNKPTTRPNAKWHRGGSSDDTGSDRKPSTSQPSKSAQSSAQSPQPTAKQRQPSIATNNTSPAQARLMATTFGGPSGDSRRGVVSPRPKGRGMNVPARRGSHVKSNRNPEAKNTFCRNVTIYGHCRYENSKSPASRLPTIALTLRTSLSLHPRSRQAEPKRECEKALQC